MAPGSVTNDFGYVNVRRARFTVLINWAALFLFREPPIRLDVSAERHQAPD